MGNVRAFREDDIPAAAALWLQTFRKRREPAPASLLSHFREMFFQNAWYTPDLPSLVYEETEGTLTGFLGVIPRRMRFQDMVIRAAVTSQFMMDTSGHRGMGALKLMRTFLAGPQDLSFTDGATAGGRAIWKAAGGDVGLLYCLEWTRVLRPAQYAVRRLENHGNVSLLAKAVKPLSLGADWLAARVRPSRYGASGSEGVVREAREDDLLAAGPEILREWRLVPDYDHASLQWLLGQARGSKKHGELRTALFRSPDNEALGWCIYYLSPSGVCRVMQIGARERTIDAVLKAFFYTAARQGAVAVTGRIEPRFIWHLSNNLCTFRCLDLDVIFHSKNEDIRNAIHRGEAFLTRLEGEMSMRFSGDAWV